MKAGFERIGRTITVERANRSCLDKKRYPSRNHARDAAARNAKVYGNAARYWYSCTLCGGFHLTSKPPYGLKPQKTTRKGGNTMTVRIQRDPQAVWRAIKTFGTQEKMAEELGVDQKTISKWGNGDRPVPWPFCIKIEAGTRRIASTRRDPALIVKCEELQPNMDWRELLELAKVRLAAGAP